MITKDKSINTEKSLEDRYIYFRFCLQILHYLSYRITFSCKIDISKAMECDYKISRERTTMCTL